MLQLHFATRLVHFSALFWVLPNYPYDINYIATVPGETNLVICQVLFASRRQNDVTQVFPAPHPARMVYG